MIQNATRQNTMMVDRGITIDNKGFQPLGRNPFLLLRSSEIFPLVQLGFATSDTHPLSKKQKKDLLS
jgi:hypothetical protein